MPDKSRVIIIATQGQIVQNISRFFITIYTYEYLNRHEPKNTFVTIYRGKNLRVFYFVQKQKSQLFQNLICQKNDKKTLWRGQFIWPRVVMIVILLRIRKIDWLVRILMDAFSNIENGF